MSAMQVQFTVDDESTGAAIVSALLDARLVACCQMIGPIESRYWWDGRLEAAREWLYLCKADESRFEAIAETITALHPYDVPEIVAVPIERGLPSYLAWVAEMTAVS